MAVPHSHSTLWAGWARALGPTVAGAFSISPRAKWQVGFRLLLCMPMVQCSSQRFPILHVFVRVFVEGIAHLHPLSAAVPLDRGNMPQVA